jgi:hypothetical protein
MEVMPISSSTKQVVQVVGVVMEGEREEEKLLGMLLRILLDLGLLELVEMGLRERR